MGLPFLKGSYQLKLGGAFLLAKNTCPMTANN
jgi:hypothetical protein